MTLYDIGIIALIVVSFGGVTWASARMEEARKTGKIKYIGKVRIDNEPK